MFASFIDGLLRALPSNSTPPPPPAVQGPGQCARGTQCVGRAPARGSRLHRSLPPTPSGRSDPNQAPRLPTPSVRCLTRLPLRPAVHQLLAGVDAGPCKPRPAGFHRVCRLSCWSIGPAAEIPAFESWHPPGSCGIEALLTISVCFFCLQVRT